LIIKRILVGCGFWVGFWVLFWILDFDFSGLGRLFGQNIVRLRKVVHKVAPLRFNKFKYSSTDEYGGAKSWGVNNGEKRGGKVVLENELGDRKIN